MQSTMTKIKKPVNAFPKCPCCLTDHQLSVGGIHVFCGFCGWDSVRAYTEVGGYDSADREAVSVSEYFLSNY